MAKRSHEALNARDRGRTGLPLHDTAADHARGPHRPRPPAPACSYWLRRTRTHLEPPSPARPYWTVRTHTGRYLAAGRTRDRAITNAMATVRARHAPS